MDDSIGTRQARKLHKILMWVAFTPLCALTVVLCVSQIVHYNGLDQTASKQTDFTGQALPTVEPDSILREWLPAAFDKPGRPWHSKTSFSLTDCKYIVDKPLATYRLVLPARTIQAIDKTVAELLARPAQVLTEQDRVWYEGEFREGNKVYKVKARLRGDLAAHWAGKWKSWRIRFPKTDLFHGIRNLNFIRIEDRGLYADALGCHLARTQGLLVLRDGFGCLALNDGKAYVYYMAESPSREFLEANGRPVSAIFRARDISFEYLSKGKTGRQIGTQGSPEFFENYISNKARSTQYNAALQQLLGAMTVRDFSQILDLRKFAALEAITYIMGTRHALGPNNSYLYYDETTGLFEPIPWDVNVDSLSKDLLNGLELGPLYPPQRIQVHLVRYSRYRHLRDRIIWQWVKDGPEKVCSVLRYMHSCVGPSYQPKHKIQNHGFAKQVTDKVAANIEALKRELSFTKVFVDSRVGDCTDPTAVHSVRVRNSSTAGVAIQEMQIDARLSPDSGELALYWDKNRNKKLDKSDPRLGRFQENKRVARLVFTAEKIVPVFSKLAPSFELLPDEETFFFTGGRMAQQPRKCHFTFINCITLATLSRDDVWDSLSNMKHAAHYALKVRTRDAFLRAHKQFRPADDNDRIVLPKGDYSFEQDVVIPMETGLDIAPGTVLRFAPGKSLFCYSTLIATGTEAEPIVFQAADPEQGWGVVAIVGPQQDKSTLHHALFREYGEASFANTFFSGGLSGYSAPVDLLHCSFVNGTGEDAVNLKASRGIIRDCLFEKNPSDAIDLDLSDVPVVNCVFRSNGGDAIDLSGTKTSLRGNIILDSGDKGISLGERSDVVICNTYISGCQMGIAVKDSSTARVLCSTLTDNKAAIVCYQKKAVFGSGKADLSYCVVWANRNLRSLDTWSRCRFEKCLLQSIPKGQEDNFSSDPQFADTQRGAKVLVVSDSAPAQELLSQAARKALQEALDLPTTPQGHWPIGYHGRKGTSGHGG